MIKFTFLLSREQRDFLEQKAEKKDRSVSYVLRELIDGQLDDQNNIEGDQDEDSN